MSRNLGDTFNELFVLEPALDRASIDLVHRVRHDVYCRDLGWEPLRPDGMEIDRYDSHSIHCLLRRRDSGVAVGCTRLILTRPEAPHELLPFEESCKDVIDRSLIDPSRLPRDAIGEVSRLAVTSRFRQRKGEAAMPVPISEDDFESRAGTPRFPFIPVSLYLGAGIVARHMGVEHVFVLTEPRLASHFAKIGFHISVIGGPIEHHGTHMPSVLSSSKAVAGLRPLITPLYEVIKASVESAFRQPRGAEPAVDGRPAALRRRLTP